MRDFFCFVSRPEVFCKKCVLRNFAKFTGKHLRKNLFLNKVAGSVNFVKFLRTPFLTKHLRWLSHRRFSIKKDALGNFAKFTGKHLRKNLFLNKVAGSVNFVKFLRTPFLTKHLRWLSHRRFSIKKDALGNFAKFTGKHLCQRLFFNKTLGLERY